MNPIKIELSTCTGICFATIKLTGTTLELAVVRSAVVTERVCSSVHLTSSENFTEQS